MHYIFYMVAFQQFYMIALGMRKLTARWVPKSLSDEQMATRASVCSTLLKRFRSKEDDFLSYLLTVDETWVHYYEPENKAQSRQWVGPGSPRPKKFNLLYVFLCVILFLCFSVLLVLRLPRLGKRELILVLFVRLFGLCLFRFVGFLFLLGSGKGCGL